AALMLDLSQRLERGEWLAMAGDRVPLHDGRRATVDFLGRPAPFAQGPWLLAGLLGCPVNLMCCLKIAGRYEIRLERFLDAPAWERGQRDATIAGVLHVDTEVTVPFFDVDSIDVVWHGHYVKYLEIARCALLDRIGHNYAQMK